jgi:hypothetical protein
VSNPLLIECPSSDETHPPETRQVIENEIAELVDFLHLIDTLPMEHRADFYKALGRLVDGFERRRSIFKYVQETLSQMSLDLKYILFDLEATRRERDDYRHRLEEIF